MKLLSYLFIAVSLSTHAYAKPNKKLNAPYMANTIQMTLKWNWNKRKLTIKAAAPANSIVGFEHIANTAKEKRNLRLQDAKLKEHPLIEQTTCKLSQAEINTDLYYAHRHKKPTNDDDDLFHTVGNEKGQVDYLMQFEYTCQERRDLTLDVFQYFPKIKKLIVRDKNLHGKIKQILTVNKNIIQTND